MTLLFIYGNLGHEFHSLKDKNIRFKNKKEVFSFFFHSEMLNRQVPLAAGVDRRTAKPYEYDSYYNTRINRRWTYQSSPYIIGPFLILIGVLSFIFTCVDISRGALVRPLFQNPNNQVSI